MKRKKKVYMASDVQPDGVSGPTCGANQLSTKWHSRGHCWNLWKSGRSRNDLTQPRPESSRGRIFYRRLGSFRYKTEVKLTDLHRRSHRDSVRIHRVKEGVEESMASVITFVEDFARRLFLQC